MSGAGVTLEPVEDEALPYVEGLLAENGLPADDVRSKPECFYVASAAETRIGIGGLQRFGTVALLRSVVVERSARGRGFGMELCDALETRAAADDVVTLYLLTTTAAGFFADRGYVEIDRDGVPDAIQQTAEFADLCPASATCMKKSL